MSNKISIPVDEKLIAEYYARTGARANASSLLNDLLLNFLGDTRYEDDLWEPRWLDQRDDEDHDNQIDEFGSPSGGCRWGPIFLKNGTRVRMNYKGKLAIAVVKHDQLEYEGTPVSPSRFAYTVADNTSRNAWRDLWLQQPGQQDWILADTFRRREPKLT